MEDLRAKPEDYWRARLTPEQYRVCRQKGTERPFSDTLNRDHATGVYSCVACGQELFATDTKFESGTGWPSFDAPMNREHVELVEDRTHGMLRTEVLCKRCGSHLGHVFDDGPRKTTGQRYCLNAVALTFEPAESSVVKP